MKFPLLSFLTPVVFAAVALSGCIGGGDKGENGAPTAILEIQNGANDYTRIFDGSKSTDPDGDPLTYHWNWVLGQQATTEPRVEIVFPESAPANNAQYAVTLMVEDPDGLFDVSAINAVTFGTGSDRVPTADIAPTTRWVAPNTEITLDASRSADPEGQGLSYEWIWGLRNPSTEGIQGVSNACEEADPTPVVFTTGCLKKGQSFSVTLDQAGVYTIHCHPHPWMKARIVVDPSGTNTTALIIPIVNWGYPQKVFTVGVGAAVTFVNQDDVDHTATVEDFTPGIIAGGTEPTFTQTLAEGEYVVRLIVVDELGTRATKTWGLKASTEAVPNPDVRGCDSQVTALTAANGPEQTCWYNTTFAYKITAILDWAASDPGGTGVPKADFELGKVRDDGTWDKLGQCTSVVGTGFDAGKAFMDCDITGSGDYRFKVVATQGAITEWNIEVTGTPYSKPAFGDSGDGHAHQH